MKIEIDVNPGELSKSLVDILNSLTPEQKLDVARQTMEKWLREPYDIERRTKERELVEQMQKNPRGYSSERQTEDQIRKDYHFQEEMRKFRSTKEMMVEQVTKEITSLYQSEVENLVKADPAILAMKEEVVKIVKETFPAVVHTAVVTWVATSMQNMLGSVLGTEAVAAQMQQLQQNVASRLSSVESRIH